MATRLEGATSRGWLLETAEQAVLSDRVIRKAENNSSVSISIAMRLTILYEHLKIQIVFDH